jgi:hypothetical protein
MKVTYFKIQNLDTNTQEAKIIAIGNAMLEFMTPEEVEEMVFDNYEDYEIAIAFLHEYKIDRLRTVFDNAGILIEEIDITDFVLTGRIQKNVFFTELFKDENAFQSLEKFLRNNLSPDLILEKISELGIEYMTTLDREIMEA